VIEPLRAEVKLLVLDTDVVLHARTNSPRPT
jgi:hypothetical protein